MLGHPVVQLVTRLIRTLNFFFFPPLSFDNTKSQNRKEPNADAVLQAAAEPESAASPEKEISQEPDVKEAAPEAEPEAEPEPEPEEPEAEPEDKEKEPKVKRAAM